MKRRTAIRTLIVAGAASFSSRLLARVTQGVPQDFVIHSDVRLVLLDVSVKDRQGGFVPGLAQDQFAVFENGEAQRITVFANDDVPVTVGILVDESRSMLPKRNDVISAAETFIQASNPHDEIFVLNFNDAVKRGLPGQTLFSDDIEQLKAALERGIPRGRTAFNDAIVEGLQQLTLGARDKKALVVISDGGDNASRHTRAGVFAVVERSIATIYAVGLFDADDQDQNPGILRHLANVSGGEAFFPPSPSSMPAICQGIAKEIRTRYTIGYLPPANHGSLRHVQVRVSAPGHSGLRARTRTRYRYDELLSPPG
jgi:Ca-activated chloride channel homolog